MKRARKMRNLASVPALAAGCGKVMRKHLDIIRAAAAPGNRNVQQFLGDMYMQEQGGVPLDCTEAPGWYREAAAQNNMGTMYVYG